MYQIHSEGAVRHAEKRRNGTCEFANRIARTSLQMYESTVPRSYREVHKHTCVAAIVACFKLDRQNSGGAYHNKNDGDDRSRSTYQSIQDHLQVVGLGVGTKFLSAATLHQDQSCIRIRDCHAEVLARRAFRRQLLHEIEMDSDGKLNTVTGYIPILERVKEGDEDMLNQNDRSLKSNGIGYDAKSAANIPKYRLKTGCTLHFYASSSPCGNATLKKFVKMKKETFDSSMPPNQWPKQVHNPIAPHSLRLGQFALLVKKDSSLHTHVQNHSDPVSMDKSANCSDDICSDSLSLQPQIVNNTNKVSKSKPWPCRQDDSWCPPSCSITNYNKGTIHSCSDKICRWNCLGLQGSLLMTLLEDPLYMTTLTIGRKFSRAICQRAVCCRADGFVHSKSTTKYRLNHPVLMETNVYMDETGTHNMEGVKAIGQDASFDSSNSCWVWWPGKVSSFEYAAECIDGKTGLVINHNDPSEESKVSEVSHQSYTSSVVDALHNYGLPKAPNAALSFEEMASLKCLLCPDYEDAKATFLRHRVFREWCCRSKYS